MSDILASHPSARIFAHLLEEVGPSDALVLGAPEEGLLADACARQGALTVCLDEDGGRVLAARKSTAHRREAAEILPAGDPPAINQGGLSGLADRFSPSSFDFILAIEQTAEWPDLAAAFDRLYWLLRADGLLAISALHPCAAPSSADYFAPPSTGGAAAGSLQGLVRAAEERAFQLRGLAEDPGSEAGKPLILLEFGKDKWAP